MNTPMSRLSFDYKKAHIQEKINSNSNSPCVSRNDINIEGNNISMDYRFHAHNGRG